MRVMVNGLPGNMATLIAEQVLINMDFELVPFALTGPDTVEKVIRVERGAESAVVQLWRPEERETAITEVKNRYKSFLTVDYTHPSAANDNADFYCRHGLHFVMGTTGGDRTALEERVKNSGVIAVIAPNMAPEIVAFQTAMRCLAENFPGAFGGYSLKITESHQETKPDVSGTARAMVPYFNALGIQFKEEQIEMIRDPEKQRKMGVPENALNGHAWHTYTLKSEDGSVLLRFTHNVNGRNVYAQGTLKALRFLESKVDAGEKGKVYSMTDVLGKK